MSRLQKKPAAHKRGHPTLQNMNFFSFCGSFLPSWIRIRIQIPNTYPDPDPLAWLYTDPIRIQIRIRNPALKFADGIFTKIRPVLVGNLGTRLKILHVKGYMVGVLKFTLLSANFFSAVIYQVPIQVNLCKDPRSRISRAWAPLVMRCSVTLPDMFQIFYGVLQHSY